MKRCKLHVVGLAAASLLLLGGCTHVYNADYRWTPRPADVTIEQAPASAQKPVDVVISVIGLRTDSQKIAHPGTLEVGIRVDNHSDAPVAIDPGSLELITADLHPLPSPTVEPAGTLTVPPQSSKLMTAYFPVPKELRKSGALPLDGLTLRWSARVGNEVIAQTATFNRRPLVYYYPYDTWNGPSWGYGFTW